MADDLVTRLFESDEASTLTNEAARRIEALEAVAKLLGDACKEFVRKVECGEARSKRSYAQMTEALVVLEDAMPTEIEERKNESQDTPGF